MRSRDMSDVKLVVSVSDTWFLPCGCTCYLPASWAYVPSSPYQVTIKEWVTRLSFVFLRTCNHASYQLQFWFWWWKNNSHSHSCRILLLLYYPWFLLPIYKVLCDAFFVTEYMGEWPQKFLLLLLLFRYTCMYTRTYTHCLTLFRLISNKLGIDLWLYLCLKYGRVTPLMYSSYLSFYSIGPVIDL